ncbi:ATP-binding protein, partial [Candidatus Micrarchaeota archaeon]|nr:ATP-binding protein [Candidatus Micrarchaeota archaeon]
NNKITIILGSRQVGKTTVLNALYEKFSENNCLFLDLDVLENFEKVSSYTNLINTLKLEGYELNQKKMFYLFLDEFQRYEDLSVIMKNVYDNHKNIKIYASGSSSLKIREQIQESLAGRKRLYYLYPLDFEEFLWFKEDSKATNQLKNINKLSGKNLGLGLLKGYLKEYLVFGGYPEVVLTNKHEKKVDVLKSIFDLYVKKELVGYLKFGKIVGVKKLIEYIATNNGQKIKYEEAAYKCSLKQYEVKEYIEILKETFLVTLVRPFFSNKNKELIKIPKIYFLDNGVRNFFINNFNKVELRNDSGFLFEGFVLQELIKTRADNIKFWQDKQRHEVDFIVDLISRQIPVETKFKEKLKQSDFIGLNTFLENYNIKKAFLINLSMQKNNKKIKIKLPFNLSKNIKF